jgi:hypothetical protein
MLLALSLQLNLSPVFAPIPFLELSMPHPWMNNQPPHAVLAAPLQHRFTADLEKWNHEPSIAKVALLDTLMQQIAAKLGIDQPFKSPSDAALPPSTVIVPVADSGAGPANITITQPESPSPSLRSDGSLLQSPDGCRLLTHVGLPSTNTTLSENRHSLIDPVSADVSQTDVGPAG